MSISQIERGGLAAWQRAAAGSVGRNIHDKLDDVVHVRDFGAVMTGANGSTADEDALLAAINSIPAGKPGVIHGDGGLLRLTQNFAWPANRGLIKLVDFRFYAPDHTFTMMTIPRSAYGLIFDNVRFFTDGVSSSATEVFALLNDGDTFTAYNLEVQNVYSGIKSTGPKHIYYGRTQVTAAKAAVGRGLVVQQPSSPTTELFRVEYFLGNNGTDSLSGVDIVSGSQIEIGGGAYKSGNCMRIIPGVGEVVATLQLMDWNSDTSTGNGIWFSGSGAIQRVRGTCHATSNGGDGIRVDNAPSSANLSGVVHNNTGRGVRLGGVDHKNSWYQFSCYGNGVHGFEVVAGAANFRADIVSGVGDGFLGNASYGLVIGSGCDHFRITLDGSGNTVGLFFNGSTLSSTAILSTRG